MNRPTSIWFAVLITLATGSLFFSQTVRSQIAAPNAVGSSLRMFGTGLSDVDRVKIPLDSSGVTRPVNVGLDLTVELWIKAGAAENASAACDPERGWYYGRVLVDRDIFGEADAYGDYGLAIMDGRIIAGVNTAAGEQHLCSSVSVTDNQWRHVAFTRSAATGELRLFIDGAPAGEVSGPTGRLDYAIGRATDYPASDPFLVLGAEKHDFPGSLYYNGLLDDLRISNNVRYSAAFTRPGAPHPTDAATVALYRFDEGAGVQIGDSSGASGGPSNGLLIPRNNANPAEHWSNDTPFTTAPPPSPTSSATATPTSSPTGAPTSSPIGAPTSSPTATPTSSPTPKPKCNGSGTPTGTANSTPTIATPTAAARPATPSVTSYRIFLPLITCP